MAELALPINGELKEKAFSIIKECGLTPSQVIEFFFQEIVALKTIPMVIKRTEEENKADFTRFFGAVKFEGNILERQKELRSEWDTKIST